MSATTPPKGPVIYEYQRILAWHQIHNSVFLITKTEQLSPTKQLPATQPEISVWHAVRLYKNCHIRDINNYFIAPHTNCITVRSGLKSLLQQYLFTIIMKCWRYMQDHLTWENIKPIKTICQKKHRHFSLKHQDGALRIV